MRILMLAQNYAPIVGGEERMVEDLSLELHDRGHRVAVATLGGPHAGEYETRDCVRVYALRSSLYPPSGRAESGKRPQAPPAPDPRTVVDLRRVLRRERPDVVHAHNWLVHSYLPLHHGSGPALVLSLHDYGLICATKRLFRRGFQCTGPGPAKCLECASRHYGLKGSAVAMGTLLRGPVLRRRADLLVPVSAAVRDRCAIRSTEPHRVIPNFVRDRPTPSIEDDRLALLPDEPYVLFLGDATVDKGARLLADVYRTLDQPPPLVFIGRCFVEDLAQDPAIRAVGPWPHELAQVALDRALFVAVPTIMGEAFGLAALESAAAGKAVVASEVGGLGEIVIDGETGLLVTPGDPAALRAALVRLIADGPLRTRLGEAAARRAHAFRAQAVVPAFEDAYAAAIELHRRDRSRTDRAGESH